MIKDAHSSVKIGTGFWVSMVFVVLTVLGSILAIHYWVPNTNNALGATGVAIVFLSSIAGVICIGISIQKENFLKIETRFYYIEDIVKRKRYIIIKRDGTTSLSDAYYAVVRNLFNMYYVYTGIKGVRVCSTTEEDLKQYVDELILRNSKNKEEFEKYIPRYTIKKEVKL